MTATLKVDTIQNPQGISISTANMQRRIVQRVSYVYRGGFWRGDNTYYWVPGAYLDFRPMRGDSRIRVTVCVPTRDYGSNHMIQHWIFYVAEQEQGRHSRGGHHVENAFATEWDVPSWGAGQIQRIGYKVRAYSDGNHNAHLYLLQYWNGGGNSLRVPGQIMAEEYTSAPT